MERIINWFGLAAGILTFVLLIISIYIPWWQLTLGNNFISIYASPIVTNFGLYGSQFNIPLIWAWNLSNILLFTAGGILMLVYSLMPTKSYAKDLLSFSWKKPLYAFLSFTLGLIVIVVAAGLFDINFPLMGSQEVTLNFPDFIPLTASITSTVTASFMLPFWLAIAVVALCIIARVQHVRIEKKIKQIAVNTIPVAPTEMPSPMTPAVTETPQPPIETK